MVSWIVVLLLIFLAKVMKIMSKLTYVTRKVFDNMKSMYSLVWLILMLSGKAFFRMDDSQM